MEVILYNPQQQGNTINNQLSVAVNNQPIVSKPAFIESNTEEVSLQELQHHRIIPSFTDGTVLISHSDFVSTAATVVHQRFQAEHILAPSIRVSHKIVGRHPDAKDKPVTELQDWERTTFYQRAMFVIEVASITDSIDGHVVSLMIGGARMYDSMNQRSGSDETFKVCCGFSVRICSNLMISCKGLSKEIRVKNLHQLEEAISELVSSYDAISDLHLFQRLQQYSLGETQFAQVLGRARLYTHLSTQAKRDLPELLYGDTQLNSIAREYLKSEAFSKEADGGINLFKVHNLFTEANKSSYLDSFLTRSVNASSFIEGLAAHLEGKQSNWFLG